MAIVFNKQHFPLNTSWSHDMPAMMGMASVFTVNQKNFTVCRKTMEIFVLDVAHSTHTCSKNTHWELNKKHDENQLIFEDKPILILGCMADSGSTEKQTRRKSDLTQIIVTMWLVPEDTSSCGVPELCFRNTMNLLLLQMKGSYNWLLSH